MKSIVRELAVMVASIGVLSPLSLALSSPAGIDELCFIETSFVGQQGRAVFNATASNDEGGVWAVGSEGDLPRAPLIASWDGSGWQQRSFSTRTLRAELNGAAPGRKPGTAWAVGASGDYAGGYWFSKNLAIYFDGTSWTEVPTPNRGDPSFVNQLNAIAQVAPDEWYAVGQWKAFPDDAPIFTLVLHYLNGSWQLVDDGEELNYLLTGVSATSPNDVWISGYRPRTGGGNFVEHWDGLSWTRFDLPNPGLDWNEADSISAIAPDDVWVAGMAHGDRWFPVVLHYDGSAWNQVQGLPPRSGGFRTIQALRSGQVWAAGWYDYGARAAPWLVEWTGHDWREHALPDAETNPPNVVNGLTVTVENITAVGFKITPQLTTIATAFRSTSCEAVEEVGAIGP